MNTTKDKKYYKDRERYMKQNILTPREIAIVFNCSEGEVDKTIISLAKVYKIKSNNRFDFSGKCASSFIRMYYDRNRTYYDGNSLRNFLSQIEK